MAGLFSSSQPAYLSLVHTGVGIQQFRFPVVLQVGNMNFSYGSNVFSRMPGAEINDLNERLRRARFY